MESDEGLYHATPQTQGRIAHETVDEKKGSTSKDVISTNRNIAKPFDN